MVDDPDAMIALPSTTPLSRANVLDASEHGHRLRLVDHLLLDHEPDVARDLATRIGQRTLRLPGRAALLGVDQPHLAAAERERQRDLAADSARPEHRDGLAHARRPRSRT